MEARKIIITGGATRIGAAIAKKLSGPNKEILIHFNKSKLKAEKLKKELSNNGTKVYLVKGDLSKENDVNKIVKYAKSKLKYFDCLINNVGIAGPTGTIEKLKSEDWENTLKVNVISHFYFTKLAIPMLKKNKGGSIINLSSGAGIMGFPLRSPYAASKWAIVGVTKTLAMELGKYKIRVNAICPGTIKGDRMVRVIRDKSKFLKISKKHIEKEFVSMASMNCWIYEEDIGKMCSFLISNEAERISGQIIGVDGNAIRLD